MTTVVMVHGAFCGGWTFERFRTPFEARGWTVLTPDLRGHEPGAKPDAVVGVSMTDYAADIASLCQAQAEPPILIGHSMGGLVAQMAARRVKLKALVLLAPSPPWGVAGSSMGEAAIALGVQMLSALSIGAVPPDLGAMRQFCVDRVAAPEREAILARMSVESGRAVRETLNWWLDPFMTTSVGPGPLGVPTLAIAGERDAGHPPATVQQTARRIGAAMETMPGMSHWLPGELGWEDVAQTAITWLSREVRTAA
jgi:pimeloyl-ACP methyl ester carboxylesterase